MKNAESLLTVRRVLKSAVKRLLGEAGVTTLMVSYWRLRNRCQIGYEIEVEFLSQWVKRGDLVVDVGANMGQYSVALWRLVGASGRVVAFEASPSTAAITRRILNGTGVELMACALSDREGTVELELFADDDGNLIRGHTRVSGAGAWREIAKKETSLVRRLDNVLANRQSTVAFMKIDVEGHELSVLAGAGQILSQDSPKLLIEANGPVAFDTVRKFLAPLGYLASFCGASCQMHSASAYIEGVNNYLFSRRSA